MKRPELIIFDMDGLLLDTEIIANESWIEAGKNRDIKITGDILRKIKGGNRENSIKVLKNVVNENELFEFIEEKRKIQRQIIEKRGIDLKKGVLELLTFLKEKNVKMVVATSSEKNIAEKELKDTKIYNYFDDFVFGDEVKNGKPHPEIFLKACDKFKVEPNEAFVLEDSVLGLKAAISGGIKCIVVEDTVKLTDEENRLPFKKFEDLIKVRDFFIEFF